MLVKGNRNDLNWYPGHMTRTKRDLQDKLNNQMATEKKIVRPSDDPVVAIRALRLRTNVSQVTQ